MKYPLHPPKEWFSRPTDLKPGMGTTITEEGRVYGYLALRDSRHINGGRGNVKPPKSASNYAYANAYQTKCEDGSTVATGTISGRGGHHYHSTFEETQAAYADVANRVARVTYGEDMHGIWFSGALWPEVSEEDVEIFRSSGVSGHWERPKAGGSMELLGACLVNISGFSQHRLCAAATPSGGVILRPSDEEVQDRIEPIFSPGKTVPGGVHFGRLKNRLVASGGVLVPISGTLAILNSPTIDGRVIRDVQVPELPLPLMYCPEGWGNHQGQVLVGAIQDVEVDGSMVNFKGVIDTGLEKAAEVEVAANLGVMGISMDGFIPQGSEVEIEYDSEGWPETFIFNEYGLIGATLTPTPAFQETRGVEAGEGSGEGTGEPMPTEEAEEYNSDDELGADPEQFDTEPASGETSEQGEGLAASAGVTKISPPLVWR